MDFKKFIEFTSSVFDHNYALQKQLGNDDNILTIKHLQSLSEEFPLAEFYLHYPNDAQAETLNFCYSVNSEGPNQLLPVLSFIANEDKIVFSYLSQEELNQLDFSDSFKLHPDYYNSVRILKFLFDDRRIFSPQPGAMIFMEHIPDSLNWVSDSANNKIHQPFSFIGVKTLMLWDAYYFTPHY